MTIEHEVIGERSSSGQRKSSTKPYREITSGEQTQHSASQKGEAVL